MYSLEFARNQYPILLYHQKALHSKIDPTRQGLHFYQQKQLFFQENPQELKIIVFTIGFGLGYSLWSLRNRPEIQKNLIIWVMNLHQEKEYFDRFAPEEIKQSFSIHFFDPNKEEEMLLFQKALTFMFYKNILVEKISLVEKMFDEEYHQSHLKVMTQIKQKLYNLITDSAVGKRWWHNFLINFVQESLSPWKFMNHSSFSCLLIGSGLSTYKNLDRIAQIQHQNLIITVLPVVDLLFKKGIIPDVVVITDGGEANRYYTFIQKLNQYPQVLIIGYLYIYPFLNQQFQGKKLFCNAGIEIEASLTPDFLFFPSGGSVASTMLTIATQITSKIRYIGFDFGFTDQHPHFPGGALEEVYLIRATRLSPLENVMARKVQEFSLKNAQGHPTTPALKAYEDFFQTQVIEWQKQNKDLRPLLENDCFDYSVKPFYSDFVNVSTPMDGNQKKERLYLLRQQIQMIQEKKDWQNPFTKLILSRALLKKEDCSAVLAQEIAFLNKCLQFLK